MFDAVDSVVDFGIAILSGTKIPAVNYANRVIRNLKPYTNIEPIIGYENVPNEGYLYYVHDLNRFGIGSKRLKEIVLKIDEQNIIG